LTQENAQLAQARETANQALPLALDEVLTDLPNRCNPSARLHQELHTPAPSQPGLVRPGIGIAMYPGDGHTPPCVMHSADTSMYLATRTHAGFAFHEQRASG
jgi:predicted signal transduction protein with EAL and GGDEF domain